MNTAQNKPIVKGGQKYRGGDASAHAQRVYGGIDNQHAGSSGNLIAMNGGRKRRRSKKRRNSRRKSRSSRSSKSMKSFKFW